MLYNTATKIKFYVVNSLTGLPFTGLTDLTAYVSIDGGALTALADTSSTEISATNAPGVYTFDVAAGETAGYQLDFTAKSATSNTLVYPRFVQTTKQTGDAFAISTTGAASAATAVTQSTTAATQSTAAAATGVTNGTAIAAVATAQTSQNSTYLTPLASLVARLVGAIIVDFGTPVAGTSTTITLGSAASAVDNKYKGHTVVYGGEAHTIASYVGATKVATLVKSWVEVPLTSGTYYVITDKSILTPTVIDGKTIPQALQAIVAAVSGIILDADTVTNTFKGMDGVTDRVVVTVDASGNRSAVTYP